VEGVCGSGRTPAASPVNRIVPPPHEDAEDFEYRRHHTRFEAIFLAGLRRRNARGINAEGIDREFTSAPRISLVAQSSSAEPSSESVD